MNLSDHLVKIKDRKNKKRSKVEAVQSLLLVYYRGYQTHTNEHIGKIGRVECMSVGWPNHKGEEMLAKVIIDQQVHWILVDQLESVYE